MKIWISVIHRPRTPKEPRVQISHSDKAVRRDLQDYYRCMSEAPEDTSGMDMNDMADLILNQLGESVFITRQVVEIG